MKVFLDIDGVLSAFNLWVHEKLGRPYNYDTLTEWHWFREIGVPFHRINEICTEDFWATMPWMHDGRAILKAVEEFSRNITLVTAPMPNPGSWTGKDRWVLKNLPKYADRLIVTPAPKKLLCGGLDCLLIDDKNENVDDWVAEGGSAILVPRPYNNNRALSHGRDPVTHVKAELEKLRSIS